jgi:uncharacterized protein (DUF1501 family)
MGPSARGGLIGQHPSLRPEDLDYERTVTDRLSGDLRFHTDFRRVYATLLDRWLGCDSQRVLGGRYEHLELLRA